MFEKITPRHLHGTRRCCQQKTTLPTKNGPSSAKILYYEKRYYKNPYDENEEPQPHDRDELGLMKWNPWRISVSS